MNEKTLTRRQLLRHGGILAAVPLLHGCDTTVTTLCADPELLSRGEEQMRNTLQYVELSTTADQSCTNCQFFRADTGKECGHCEILNGWVSEQAYCTSWALRS